MPPSTMTICSAGTLSPAESRRKAVLAWVWNWLAALLLRGFREDVGSSRNAAGADEEDSVDASKAGAVFVAVGNPPPG